MDFLVIYRSIFVRRVSSLFLNIQTGEQHFALLSLSCSPVCVLLNMSCSPVCVKMFPAIPLVTPHVVPIAPLSTRHVVYE